LIEDPPKGIPKGAFELRIPYFRIGRWWVFVFSGSKGFNVVPIFPEEGGAVGFSFSKKIGLRRFCEMEFLPRKGKRKK
jgi:hypothetical protein